MTMSNHSGIALLICLVTFFTSQPVLAASSEVLTTFTELKSYHSECPSAGTTSGACRAAASRFCGASGYVTGFGPTEFSGDNAIVTCLDSSSVSKLLVSLSDLTEKNSGCFLSTINSGQCRSAIDLYCAANNFDKGGIGPLENSSNAAWIGCVGGVGKRKLTASYTQLSLEYPGCTSTTMANQECTTATSRYCRSKLYMTGLPPFQSSASVATFSCIENSSPQITQDLRYQSINFAHIKWSERPKTILNGTGCNETRYIQSPTNPDLFVGRRFVGYKDGDACAPRDTWKLILSKLNRQTNKFETIGDMLTPPVSILNGSHTIDTAFDPSIIQFNGEAWIAFECGGKNNSGGVNLFGSTSAACIAPLGQFGQVLLDRTNIVVSGGSYVASDPYKYSASVPKLLLHQNKLYLYWTSVKIRKSNEAWQSIVTKGIELEVSGRKLFAKGNRGPVVANDPGAVTVWDASYGDVLADVSDIKSDGRWIYALAGVGTCVDPNKLTPGCYRFVLSKTLSPLSVNTFGANIINDSLPNDPAGYPTLINFDGKLSLLAHFLTPQPGAVMGTGIQILDLGSSNVPSVVQPSNCDTASQTAPNWGLTRGACLPSCGGIGGTTALNNYETCASKGLLNAGAAYDADSCCKNTP